MPRERKDVYKLPPGDKTLDWYAKAVAAMQARPANDPLNWKNQAAVHGIQPAPPPANLYLAQCQHASSFFLPWHRMYILHFERIIAGHVAQLGGPADWALPYWNYSTSDPATLALPPAFRSSTLANGASNPLYVAQRNPNANRGLPVLGPRDVNLACLRAAGNTSVGGFFGGAPSAHFGSISGALELTPHNAVHRQVGNVAGGYMADPDLAALDPIFWLHHSNIDRLWEVWLNCDPSHVNLTTPYWLTGVTFHFHDATGSPITMRSIDVLNLTAPMLDYKYTDTSCPNAFKGGGIVAARTTSGGSGVGPSLGILRPMATPQHELVGATPSAVHLDDRAARVSLPTPVSPRAFRMAAMNAPVSETAGPRQLVERAELHLEQVISTDVAPTYDVFVNVPKGEDPNKHEDRFVGRVAMFGIRQASDPKGLHGGGGQTFALDITELYHRLSDAGEINPNALDVTFVPVDPLGKPDVTIGRVSLYFT